MRIPPCPTRRARPRFSHPFDSQETAPGQARPLPRDARLHNLMQPGTHLVHQEVTAPLGRGGMGEVWRARDTKLGREVSIKVLPVELARDAERRPGSSGKPGLQWLGDQRPGIVVRAARRPVAGVPRVGVLPGGASSRASGADRLVLCGQPLRAPVRQCAGGRSRLQGGYPCGYSAAAGRPRHAEWLNSTTRSSP